MTNIDTTELRELAAAATPGPWELSRRNGTASVTGRVDCHPKTDKQSRAYYQHIGTFSQRDPHPNYGGGITQEEAVANATLATAAPALLNEVERLRARVAELEAGEGKLACCVLCEMPLDRTYPEEPGAEVEKGWPQCVNPVCPAHGEQKASVAYRTVADTIGHMRTVCTRYAEHNWDESARYAIDTLGDTLCKTVISLGVLRNYVANDFPPEMPQQETLLRSIDTLLYYARNPGGNSALLAPAIEEAQP